MFPPRLAKSPAEELGTEPGMPVVSSVSCDRLPFLFALQLPPPLPPSHWPMELRLTRDIHMTSEVSTTPSRPPPISARVVSEVIRVLEGRSVNRFGTRDEDDLPFHLVGKLPWKLFHLRRHAWMLTVALVRAIHDRNRNYGWK